ncbi:MAG: helix-turn-helix domain-containing protein [Deltaproteobacteria bacterium]|nr:helix-turn-helix domain-containing protein [Deltaproteobacteria bacterium]
MKSLTDLDYYEILEISPDTPASGVERAYQLALATYAEDSLAGYSVFESGDAATMRERIETAYRVLSDAEARIGYDATLVTEIEAQTPSVADSLPPLAATLPETLSEIEPLEAFDEDSNDYDGSRLRRSRLRRGLEIESVAQVTKVNPTYLRFLEEERFADLPPRVYVRGFLMAFATCVGLDPHAVAGSYLVRFDDATKAVSRRFRGA